MPYGTIYSELCMEFIDLLNGSLILETCSKLKSNVVSELCWDEISYDPHQLNSSS